MSADQATDTKPRGLAVPTVGGAWGSLLALAPALESHPAAHAGWAWHSTPGWQTNRRPWLAPGHPQASPARRTQGRCLVSEPHCREAPRGLPLAGLLLETVMVLCAFPSTSIFPLPGPPPSAGRPSPAAGLNDASNPRGRAGDRGRAAQQGGQPRAAPGLCSQPRLTPLCSGGTSWRAASRGWCCYDCGIWGTQGSKQGLPFPHPGVWGARAAGQGRGSCRWTLDLGRPTLRTRQLLPSAFGGNARSLRLAGRHLASVCKPVSCTEEIQSGCF